MLLELDNVLDPTLSSRLCVDEYSRKLADKADLLFACCDGKDIGLIIILISAIVQIVW